VVGDWRTLHSEELRRLYASPNIITVIKSMTIKRVGHVARMVENEKFIQLIQVRKSQCLKPLRRYRYTKMIILKRVS